MNLSIILAEIPWFGGWELETTFYVDLKQWCWFNHRYDKGNFKDCSICKDLNIEASDSMFLDFSVSVLCFTFMLEGIRP